MPTRVNYHLRCVFCDRVWTTPRRNPSLTCRRCGRRILLCRVTKHERRTNQRGDVAWYGELERGRTWFVIVHRMDAASPTVGLTSSNPLAGA